MRRATWAIAACFIAMLSPIPPAAQAVVASWYTERDVSVRGAGCGSFSRVDLELPAGAFDISASPEIGATFNEVSSGEPVARLIGAQIEPGSSPPVFMFGIQATDDVCAHPERYAGAWRARETTFTVNYRRVERVWFAGYQNGTKLSARVRGIHGGSDFGWTRGRWYSWNGATARGFARFYFVEKNPGLYRTLRRSARVTLSAPKLCDDGRFYYTRLQTTIRGRRMPYWPRRFTTSFPCAEDLG